MKYFYNLKYHLRNFSYKKVGSLLLSSKSVKSLKKNKEEKAENLSMINSFEKKNQKKTLFKEYRNSIKKNSNSFSEIFNKQKNKNSFINLSRNYNISKIKKETPCPSRFFSSKNSFNKSNDEETQLINDNEKKAKFLLFKKFPQLSDDIYNLNRLYKKREIIKKKMDFTNKNIIKIPENKKQFNFNENIDMKIKILKNIKKTNDIKRKLLKKVYYKLGDKDYKNIQKIIENREYNINIKVENDPFENVQNEYKKNFKRLKNEYKFYPYNYLEEHKNIDPKAFKFMVNNFNSNFSLFGSDKVPIYRFKTFYKRKEIPIINKPSIVYINRIKRMKSKEIKLNL